MPADSSNNKSKQQASLGVPYCLPFGNIHVVKKVDLFYAMEDGTPIKMQHPSHDQKDAVIVRWGHGPEYYTRQLSDFVPTCIARGEYLSKSRLSNTSFFNFKGLTTSKDCIQKINWDTVSIENKEYRIIQYVDYESDYMSVIETMIEYQSVKMPTYALYTGELIDEEEVEMIEHKTPIEIDVQINITQSDLLLIEPEEFEKRRLDTAQTFKEEVKKSEAKTPTPLTKPPSIILKNDIENMKLALNKYEIKHLYHITHASNLDSILQYGLLSHNAAHDHKMVKKDISMQDVNARRDRIEPILFRNLQDYVPLYFNAHNPMMYLRHLTESDLVVIQISSEVLLREKVLFTDGNAASKATQFFSSDADFEMINFDIIKGDTWTGIPDGKRKICAEVLVGERTDVQYFERIIVRTIGQQSRLSGLVEEIPHMNIQLNPGLFFG